MCLKNKIISVALCAIAAIAGMFVAGTDTAQAENLTTTSAAGMSLEQMQQLIMKLQEQIAYIIQLLVQQQKPVCGNGVCETAKGETAASCPKDCGTASVCGRTDLLASDISRCTAAGGTIKCYETPCTAPAGSSCIGTKCTCDCNSCAKEGEVFPGNTRDCCSGLEKVYSNMQPACQVGTVCSNQTNYTCRKAETRTTTPICDQNCKNKGFAGSYCSTYGTGPFTVGSDIPERCSAGGTEFGITNDCNGNGIFDASRTCCCAAITYPVCGNANCEYGEGMGNCPKDCTPSNCGKEGETITESSGRVCCYGLEQVAGPTECNWTSGSLRLCAPPTSWTCAKKTVCGNNTCESGENYSTCPADCGQISDNGKSKCVTTGGTWKYLECMSGCGIPSTRTERLQIRGMGCPAVCIQGTGCACPSGKYWASREEGCINQEPVVSCLGEGAIKEFGTSDTVDCCSGLSRISYCNESGECKNATICTAKCGNGICGDRENKYNCPADCNRTPVCGNGICETNEATVIGDPSYYGTCPSDCGNSTGDYVIGIQTGTCCACPKKILRSQIGTNGWVAYERGADYSTLRPGNCQYVSCAPCEMAY